MFRWRAKDKSPSETVEETEARLGGKGRATPKRRDAETARKQRLAPPKNRKEAAARQREKANSSREKMRTALQTGDDRYLPKRDQGPVKRFIRNYVDARVSVAEFLLPLLVLIMVLQYSGNAQMLTFSTILWEVTILMVALDTIWLLMRLKRALRAKFPDEDLKGATFYTVTRALQLRPLRMPKPKVKIGGAPK